MLTPKEAADYLGIKPGLLNQWRNSYTVQLPFYKLSARKVFYLQSDLDKYIALCRKVPFKRERKPSRKYRVKIRNFYKKTCFVCHAEFETMLFDLEACSQCRYGL